MNPKQVLQKYWTYSEFRSPQDEIIDSILEGDDVLALLPTGGGKSICYQVPGLLLPGLIIIISPLISLMKDQVDNLLSRSISATYLASTLSKQELPRRLKQITSGEFKFIYVSPEKFTSRGFENILHSIEVSLVAVDESHCISLWGRNFRPSYTTIWETIEKIRPRPILTAFTATATSTTQADIIQKLHLHNPKIFRSSFSRNISISIRKTFSTNEHQLQLYSFIKNLQVPGIIYVATRSETQLLSKKLNQLQHMLGIKKVGYYHGGLDAQVRQQTQQEFLENKLQILVATTAFGMGIDKPDIEFVIHYHPPATLEGYFQEGGRAGRSGQHATALLLFNQEHMAIHQGLLNKNEPSEIDSLLLDDVQYYIDASQCRMKALLHYFGETVQPCQMCDFCQNSRSPLAIALETHSEFLTRLQHWTQHASGHYGINEVLIITPLQAAYLACLRPTTESDCLLLPGFGKGWVRTWFTKLKSQQWYNTTEQ